MFIKWATFFIFDNKYYKRHMASCLFSKQKTYIETTTYVGQNIMGSLFVLSGKME